MTCLAPEASAACNAEVGRVVRGRVTATRTPPVKVD
jgi:hypothetical protein